jgi:spore germination protein YaaH
VQIASDKGQVGEEDGRQWEANVREIEEQFSRQYRQMTAVGTKGTRRDGKGKYRGAIGNAVVEVEREVRCTPCGRYYMRGCSHQLHTTGRN